MIKLDVGQLNCWCERQTLPEFSTHARQDNRTGIKHRKIKIP